MESNLLNAPAAVGLLLAETLIEHCWSKVKINGFSFAAIPVLKYSHKKEETFNNFDENNDASLLL